MLAVTRRKEGLEHLLEQVAQGDMRAFRQLYDETAGRLMAVTLNLLRDRQAAEDAVQVAYLRIWRNAARYDPPRGTPMAWMAVIARNAALDLAQRRKPMGSLETEEIVELAVDAVEPPDARLGHCLKKLPADQARAIVTMYTYGLSHSELAERLTVPLGTAKSWIRRGTQNLRECMDV
jgi:RNA polymerase sigma-70 factor (ECF subfamily)